jgi:chorismate mutase
MLVEELKSEIETNLGLTVDFRAVDGMLAQRNHLVVEIARLKKRAQHLPARADGHAVAAEDRDRALDMAQALDARVVALEHELRQILDDVKLRKADLDRRYNPKWGKLFKCGDINSRFGHQVKDFACVYTSAVSNFLAYPDNMYFRSTRELMPHEMGMEPV